MIYINIFDKYKKINLAIITSIKEDREDEVLFEEREEAIKEILSLDLDKAEIKKIYLEQKLDLLDKELECMLMEKMSSVKIEIKEMTNKKQANLGYTNVNRGINFFSKRV